MKRWVLPRLIWALGVMGCATLASEAGDTDAERPNAHAGPFRALRANELTTHDAPYVLKKALANFRDPSALDLSDDGTPGSSALYALATLSSAPGVYRFTASDGRSFAATPDPATPVLTRTEAWEGSALEAPEVARVGARIVLYYSADGGIGAAVSSDGSTFQKQPAPVLTTNGAPAWEGGKPPRAPSVVELGEGDYRMFYEADAKIGEAQSSDGLSFTRIGAGPVLEAATTPSDAFDGAGVGDPEAVLATTAEGRRVTRVYYTGRAGDGTSAIGLAARFGSSGALSRAAAPAFTSSRGPYAPAVVSYPSLALLFVTERAGINDASNYPAIAAGVAPATLTIPAK